MLFHPKPVGDETDLADRLARIDAILAKRKRR
jgi:hypothetical protein